MFIDSWQQNELPYPDSEIDTSFRSNFYEWLDFWQISFTASLADFPETWDPKYFHYHDWIVFFLACFMMVILMLNLLISIITMAQQEYTQNRTQTTYKTRTRNVRNKSYHLMHQFHLNLKDQSCSVSETD